MYKENTTIEQTNKITSYVRLESTLNFRLILEAQRCYSEVLSSAACDAIPMNSDMQKGIAVANFSINFVCRQNVEGIH